MRRRVQLAFFAVVLLGVSASAHAAIEDPPAATEAQAQEESTTWKFIKDNFGLNYNSFFWGPGLGQPISSPQGLSGGPDDTGLYFFNLISLKWKATERFAMDIQFRSQLVITNQWEYRHQGQRFGVSGTFLKGEGWSWSGALNSDLPIPGLAGQINTERTLLLNPGFFSFFSYAPKDSRWSLFALFAPRVWFYRDTQAVSRQDALYGGTVNKPEYTFYVNPSVNYSLNDKVGFRLGTTFEFTKFVGFDSIRRNYMPFEFGVTWNISEAFNVYTYLYTSTPLDNDLRAAQGYGDKQWWETTSIQVWLSGTIF